MENMLAPVSHTVLINESAAAVDAIKTAAGLTDQQFAALCMPVLRSFAEHVQQLPLSVSAFSSSRGAWDFGLMVAMVAYRYAGTVIFFPTLGAEERRLLEPQCRYMAFVASLATAIGTVTESAVVSTNDDEYHPLCIDTSLFAWLSSAPRNAKFAWRVPATPLSVQACAAIAAKFIPKGLLGSFDLRTVLMMYEAITPKTTMNGVESTLARVVRESVQRVLEHYRTKQAGAFQPNQAEEQVSMDDAANIANKLISAANPKILDNPLARPSTSPAQSPPQAPPQSHALAFPQGRAPENISPSLGTSLDKAGEGQPDPATQEPAAAVPGPVAHTAAQEPAPGIDVLSRANKVLIEWFSALQQHPNFPMLKDQLQMNEEGITVPVAMLGLFGVSSPSIRKMMEEAGLIIRRSDDARGIILHPGLRDRFIAPKN